MDRPARKNSVPRWPFLAERRAFSVLDLVALVCVEFFSLVINHSAAGHGCLLGGLPCPIRNGFSLLRSTHGCVESVWSRNANASAQWGIPCLLACFGWGRACRGVLNCRFCRWLVTPGGWCVWCRDSSWWLLQGQGVAVWLPGCCATQVHRHSRTGRASVLKRGKAHAKPPSAAHVC